LGQKEPAGRGSINEQQIAQQEKAHTKEPADLICALKLTFLFTYQVCEELK
jgi:hypothetical protein